jgi:hypothetical protein
MQPRAIARSLGLSAFTAYFHPGDTPQSDRAVHPELKSCRGIAARYEKLLEI